jgi:putative Mn2+ efflux pump MntP
MIHAATKSDVDAGQRAQTGVWRLVVTALATSIDQRRWVSVSRSCRSIS